MITPPASRAARMRLQDLVYCRIRYKGYVLAPISVIEVINHQYTVALQAVVVLA